MYSRVTRLAIDTPRVDVDEAVELFRREAAPVLAEQDGYEGVCVLTAPDGQGLVISLWSTSEAAAAASEAGVFPESVRRSMGLFGPPSGRDRYRVAFADAPALVIG